MGAECADCKRFLRENLELRKRVEQLTSVNKLLRESLWVSHKERDDARTEVSRLIAKIRS